MTPDRLAAELREGCLSAGAYPVFGASAELGRVANAALATAGQRVAYFLASGGHPMRVPCYRHWTTEPEHRAPQATDVVLLGRSAIPATPRIVSDLEQRLLDSRSPGALVLIEIAARPTPDEASFIQLLLASRLVRHVPVLLLVHQVSERRPVSLSAAATDALLTLWLAGGRLREPDWQGARMGESAMDELCAAGLVDHRRVGRSPWYVCVDAHAAQALTDRAGRPGAALACAARATRGLPWYPVLRIAARLRQLGPLLAAYSPEAAAAARFDDPRGLATYFQALRRAAQGAGDAEVEHIAAVNQIAAVLAVRGLSARHAQRVLALPSAPDAPPDSVADLWFAAGQALVKADTTDALAAAEAAFARGRRAVSGLPERDLARRASRHAALANGEALVALKQQRFGHARRLEQSALAVLSGAGDSDEIAGQRVLVGTHLGDVCLRGFGDRTAAVQAYRAAFDVALGCASHDVLSYVAPRLASAELQCGRPRAAVRVLDALFSRAPDDEPALLKARLSLADAYLQINRPRSAAACYWRLLRRGERLTPTAARGIAANLRRTHPAWQPHHERLVHGLLREQETTFARATDIRAVLLAA